MFYRSIHYLRAFAACAVVARHADAPMVYAAGVDVFFVISGFVMVEATRGGFSASRFVTARAARILPPWWGACVLWALCIEVMPLRDWLLFPEAVQHVSYLVRIPDLNIGWTLYYECLFYVLFTACGGDWRKASAILIGLACLWPLAPSPETNPVLLEFAFGMALARFPALRRPEFLVVGLCIYALGTDVTHTPLRPLLLGVPAALIVAGALGLEKWLPESRALHFLGSASYSIYLVHMIPLAWVKGPVGFALGVAFGCLFYVALERPVMRAIRLALSRSDSSGSPSRPVRSGSR